MKLPSWKPSTIQKTWVNHIRPYISYYTTSAIPLGNTTGFNAKWRTCASFRAPKYKTRSPLVCGDPIPLWDRHLSDLWLTSRFRAVNAQILLNALSDTLLIPPFSNCYSIFLYSLLFWTVKGRGPLGSQLAWGRTRTIDQTVDNNSASMILRYSLQP